jgi:glycosyltransferase involved in cell wall biosynthesis
MTLPERPLVSIVVPSFNQGQFIRETIDSILSQDYRPIEVLVMDGASKDATVDVLRSYDAPELQWWSEPDRGVVDAVNKGLERARGEVVAIQSSDDVYLPGAITAAVSALRAEPDLGLVFGDVEYIDAESHVHGRTALPPFSLYDYVGKLTFIPQPSAFFTAEAMRASGTWREEVSYAADAEFFLRIAAAYPARKIDQLFARYRYHDEQRDKAAARVERDWRKAIEPWTKSSDKQLRRYAKSGIDLSRLRYTPESQWIRRTVAAYRALLVNPVLLRNRDFCHTRDLLPGRYPIWKFLSRVKRFLGFAPRK